MIVKKIRQVSGFTLVEVVVILFIISLALVGVLSLIVQSLNSQTYNKNNLIAYQLGQEGMELVRRVRDSNWRAGQTWNTNLEDGDYYMDYLDTVPQVLDAPEQKLLRLDGEGFYFHDESGLATSSGFSRVINITTDGEALVLTVTISWLDHGRNYSYELATLLYDWR